MRLLARFDGHHRLIRNLRPPRSEQGLGQVDTFGEQRRSCVPFWEKMDAVNQP